MVEEAIENFKFEDIITQSKAYKDILAKVAQVADTTSTVLILGETGTGKELLCNSIYKLSDRSDKILVKVNCGSIPAELIESMLFGHEKGAFTGADKQKIGKFELAHKGTIFLDEIGELPLSLQARLLRVLQEGEIERIGNANTIKVDVRVIAATNRDLQKMVTEGTFRSDLYYRLNVFPIYNIPLRERKEDIPPLIKHFLNKTNKKTGRNVINISKKDYGFLTRYHYPGNIRELENIIERGVILSKDDTIDLQFLHKAEKVINEDEEQYVSLDEMQKRYIMKVLKATKGKVSGEGSASEILEINNKTLFSRMKKLGIDPKQY
ncbi:MAG: sigma 54-interacting transcriptional regulator [Saprospiraceae bacterium]|nr:sigma 54-interacting transcriptional regulator [Saprospiraceae bacterium]